MCSRWLRVVSFVAVAALALSGCGGGTVSRDAPDGDDGELSLLDKWQRFEDGNATLRMTNAQVSEAWRWAARTSTHRVVPAGPASVGNDPGSATPGVIWPDFPAEADVCSPGDCDIEPPPDSAWAFVPVLKHNDVPIARFNSRFTRTLTLEAEGATGDTQTDLFDSLVFGGWLDDTQFNVTLTRWCRVGEPGCAETDDTDLLYAGGGVLGFMAGRYSGTTPTGAGSASWTGVMVGMGDLASASLRRERPDVFLGDARITVDDLAAPDVDVSFTNIHNVTEGTRHRDMGWEDLRVEDGLFGRLSRESNGEGYDYLVGMFTGRGHGEVGGEFRWDGIAGAFGAKRR